MARTEDDPLSVASAMRRGGVARLRVQAVMDLAAGTRTARSSGHAPTSWWTRGAAEQASHPAVAAWRAARFRGTIVADLTAGCGGDAMALAGVADGVVAAEVDPARVELLRTNLADSAVVVRADVLRGGLQPSVWWADPARRDGGRRVKRLGEVIPAVPALVDRYGRQAAGIAVSPALDVADPDLPTEVEVEFVQVGTRLVEAVVWLGDLRDCGPPGAGEGPSGEGLRGQRSATLLPAGHHVRGSGTGSEPHVREVGRYLLEPVPALVRARLHDRLGQELGLARVSSRRAMMTGERVPDSPWFTAWEVEAVLPARAKAVRRHLQASAPDVPLEISLHGMDTDVAAWGRAVGAPPGPNGLHLHLLRVEKGGIAVLTRRVHDPLSSAG